MKRSTTIKLMSVLSLVAFLCVGAVWANPTDSPKKSTDDAKTTKASITAHLGSVQLEAELVKIHKRTAIAHKPFEMIDPKTGKKMDANQMISLPNGKKVKATEHLAELNKLEKKFNEIGYSFRDAKNGKVVISQTVVNENELQQQAKSLTGAHLAFNAQSMKALSTHADLDKKHADAVKNDADRLKNLAASTGGADAGKSAQTIKQWNYLLGNKKTVAAYLNGKIEVKGSKDDVTVSGEAKAGGYIINKEINLIKANGSVYSPAQGKSKANLHVYLLGQHVINVDKSADLNYKLADTKSHGIDVHADFHFSIGPIPVTAKVGARGKAGVRYTVNVRPAHATLQVSPFVDARVYAQVGVDLFLVSAGAGGEVVLLKDELTFGAELGVEFDPTKGPSLTEHVYAQNKMTMLSGSVYAWAKISNPFGSDPEYHHNIFSWKGLQSNGYLFNVQNTNFLIPNFQAAAAQKTTDASNASNP
jgi:hypothetical protein